MFYIAPAWTNNIEELNRDPLKNVMSLLVDGDKPVKLLVLNFLPNLRYILHVNGLTNLPFWNLWDAILNIERTDGMPLGPESLEWPADIRTAQGTRSVVGYRGNKLAARVIGNEQGFIQAVEYLDDDIYHVDIYDDRGFKAATKYFKDDRLIKQIWFNEVGQCILRYEPQAEVTVKILSNYSNFDRAEYDSLDDLLMEFISKKFAKEFDERTDGVIASSNKRMRSLMIKMQKQIPITYLLDHPGKISSADIQELVPQMEGCSSFVIPNYAIFEQFQLEVNELCRAHLDLGYPYDADMRLGNSNEERKLIIYWNIGDTNEAQSVRDASDELLDYYLKHESTGLIISTLNNEMADQVFSIVLQKLLNRYDFLDGEKDWKIINKIMFNENNGKEMQKLIYRVKLRLWKAWEINHPIKDGEVTITVDEIPESQRIDWEQFVEDMSNVLFRVGSRDYQIFADLARARIVVDMGEPYDTRTQFNAISAGIPQIIKVESPFVIHCENGWIVKEGHSLTEGLDFYLGKLGNWNIALVNTAKYMEQLEFGRQSDWWERRMRYEQR